MIRSIRRFYSTAIAVCCLLLFSIATSAQSELVGVASVIDGDTIEVQGEKIRLHGIDAPEASQRCKTNDIQWRCEPKAALALSDFIGRVTISCKLHGIDRYQRWIAVCGNGDLNINRLMVL